MTGGLALRREEDGSGLLTFSDSSPHDYSGKAEAVSVSLRSQGTVYKLVCGQRLRKALSSPIQN